MSLPRGTILCVLYCSLAVLQCHLKAGHTYYTILCGAAFYLVDIFLKNTPWLFSFALGFRTMFRNWCFFVSGLIKWADLLFLANVSGQVCLIMWPVFQVKEIWMIVTVPCHLLELEIRWHFNLFWKYVCNQINIKRSYFITATVLFLSHQNIQKALTKKKPQKHLNDVDI